MPIQPNARLIRLPDPLDQQRTHQWIVDAPMVSGGSGTVQKQGYDFLAAHALSKGYFRPRRHRLTATAYRTVRTEAFKIWQQEACVRPTIRFVRSLDDQLRQSSRAGE
jgi:hypothetical protein